MAVILVFADAHQSYCPLFCKVRQSLNFTLSLLASHFGQIARHVLLPLETFVLELSKQISRRG